MIFKLRKILERNIDTLEKSVLCIKPVAHERKSLIKTTEELESTIWQSVRHLQDRNIELEKLLDIANANLKEEEEKVDVLVKLELSRMSK